jgi:hypothetical protein
MDVSLWTVRNYWMLWAYQKPAPRSRAYFRKRGCPLKDVKISSPVAATTTEVSSAAEEQKEHNDKQEQFHNNPPIA